MPSLPPHLKDWLRRLGKEWSDDDNQPLSAEAMAAIIGLIRSYGAADPKLRGRIRASVNNRVSANLLWFAHRTAEESVRTGNPDLLKEGLLVLALGSDALGDGDILPQLSLLAHSAEKLRMNFKPLFEEALGLAGED